MNSPRCTYLHAPACSYMQPHVHAAACSHMRMYMHLHAACRCM